MELYISLAPEPAVTECTTTFIILSVSGYRVVLFLHEYFKGGPSYFPLLIGSVGWSGESIGICLTRWTMLSISDAASCHSFTVDTIITLTNCIILSVRGSIVYLLYYSFSTRVYSWEKP